MKRLTRLKLINWHSFFNETIEFGGSVLLSGENGAGKSTLLDAMQFVMTVSRNNFNKAAHEHGKRRLSGYVRYKTGKEERPYERTGQVTAHVALEFYDEARSSYFIVGAVVDSLSEDSEKTVWYRMENTQLRDDLFLQGSFPKNIDLFRATNKSGLKMISKTQIDVRKDFKARFGRLEDKFFELIPKALAFKPIDDIKDFVYAYVLDEKEVNIDALRENVRTYQEFEILLSGIRVKLGKLEAIRDRYEQISDYLRKDAYYEYYIARADLEINEEEIAAAETFIRQCTEKSARLKTAERELDERRSRKEELLRDINLELDKNEEYIAIRKVEEKIGQLQREIGGLKEEKLRLMASVRDAVKSAAALLKAADQGRLDIPPVVEEFRALFSELERCSDVSGAYELVEKMIAFKKQSGGAVDQAIFELRNRKRQLADEIKELNHKIQNLSNKKLDYGVNVTRLQTGIREELLRLGRSREPRVLCELLDITDARWRNAVEGYLNTQKFYLLVEPEDFEIALSLYERMKKSHGIYGVGVINTKKLEDFDKEREGSLAVKISSKNIYAKRFANMLLNNVMLCERVEELKLHKKAITPSCVRYQNRVAVVINPALYEVPYIGAEAYKVQLEQAKRLMAEKQKAAAELEEELKSLTALRGLLDYQAETDISYRMASLLELRAKKLALEEAEKERKRLSENSTLIFKRMEQDKLKAELNALNEETRMNLQEQGSYLNQIQDKTDHKLRLERRNGELRDALSAVTDKLGQAAPICGQEYEKIRRNKDLRKLREDYENTKKGNLTRKENLERELIQHMTQYKSEHDFGAEASLRGYPAFRETYNKLKNSELLDYEEKVQKARLAAEQEFREQFLSKLQENIKKAHGEFNELNKALSAIPFSGDFYRFEYDASRKHRQYYSMIMDDFNVIEGESLFSGAFNERHRQVIDELFEKLTAEGEHSGKILEEFTDYRTYMDYDIRINHSDGGYSYYSKVCEEKSGGETQTPFYVTVAASFMQMYSNSIGGDAIGLILLDEAFNNMDDERISGVLEFFGKLPLQIVVAAPPDKIQYIQPALKHTLLVLKDGGGSYVEDFTSGGA